MGQGRNGTRALCWRVYTAWGLVALAIGACTSGSPARPDTAFVGTGDDTETAEASDDSGDATGEGSSSDAFPPPDMSGALPGEGSTSAGDFAGCSISEQDCPADEKCTMWAPDGSGFPDAVRCVAVPDEVRQPGDLCEAMDPPSGEDDCAAGSFCQRGAEDQTQGVCVPYCMGAPGEVRCEDPIHTCAVFFGIAPICLHACEPSADECPLGQSCQSVPNGPSVCADEDWNE